MYFLKKAYVHIRSNKQVFVASVSSLAMAASIFGLFFFVFINLTAFMDSWTQQVQMAVYLDDNMTKVEQEEFEKILTRHPNVEAVTYISREVAWQKFQGMFSVDSHFLQSLDFNPLPASYNIRFKSSENQVDNIREFAKVIEQQNRVESVEYGEKWISRFEAFVIMLRLFLIALGGLIFIGMVLVISNTTKLSAYSRKDEVELMLLIGASPRYIKGPFIFEGLILALTGALISLGIIKAVHLYLQYQFQDSLGSMTRGLHFYFFQESYVLVYIFGSLFIGWLGSNFSISQILKSYNK